MKSLNICAAALFLLSSILVSAADRSPAPVFHFIKFPGSVHTTLYGVSNTGFGVGIYYDSNSVQHGYMVSPSGKFTTIDNPGGTTYLEGINSSGTATGYYIDSSSNYFAFVYSKGVFTNITPPGGSQTLAFGINDNGLVTGEYIDPNTGLDEGFTFDGTNYVTILSPQSGSPALGYDTNVHGISTVQWGDSNGDTESSLFNGTSYQTVNVPGAVNSYIHDINSAGDIVYSWTDSSGNYHGAARISGKITTFDAPGCSGGTFADGINDHHIIVGACHQAGSNSVGFYVQY